MNELAKWIPTILTLINTGIFALFAKSLLPKYFEEKGKNLATKEDIGEITKIVEDAKIVFTTQTELLKANLQFYNNLKTGISTEERNAIVDFNSTLFFWHDSLTDSGLNDVNLKDNEDLRKHIAFLNKLHKDVLRSQAKLRLFIEDSGLQTIANNLIISTLKGLNLNIVQYMKELMENNDYMNSIPPDITPFEKGKRMQKLDLDRKEIRDKYSKAMLEEFGKIVPIVEDFMHSARAHMNRLMIN